MRFLAFTNLQAFVFAAVIASAILALYFLKYKRQRIVISSVLLWRRVIENRLENSLFEKLRRAFSVLIAILTGLLIALAIARPEIDWLSGKPRHAVIVLDTSPSMQARTSDGQTRWQHATERALRIVNEGSVSTQFRVTDTADQFDTPWTTDRAELGRAIGRMHPVSSSLRFPDVHGAEDIYVITDGVSSYPTPASTSVISVYEAAPNVGITAFEIRSTPSSTIAYEAYLEVWNFGKDARDVEINISGAGQQRITRKPRLNAGQSYKETLDLSQFDGGGIRAAVHSDGDALSIDDVAYAYVPVKRRTKTLLVTPGNKLVETALRLDRLIDLSVTDPKAYDPNGDFDAVVFDGFAPFDPPSRPALIFGMQRSPWLGRAVGMVERPIFESVREGHPALQSISLHDVSIAKATRIDASRLNVLASGSGNMPLIVASERPRWIMLTFDLRDSDFAYHSAFPLFVDNAMGWLARERLALRGRPGVVDVPISGAQIRTIDGRVVPSAAYAGNTTFEAREPGLYVATASNERQYIAVNFADRRHSDINNSRLRDSGVRQIYASVVRRELWFYMVIVALLLVGAEWWTYHRRVTL